MFQILQKLPACPVVFFEKKNSKPKIQIPTKNQKSHLIMIIDSGAEISLVSSRSLSHINVTRTRPVPPEFVFTNANGSKINPISLVSFFVFDVNGSRVDIVDAVVIEGSHVPINQLLCSFPDQQRNQISINCDVPCQTKNTIKKRA